MSGSVTVVGAGNSSVALTGNDYAYDHASMFQALTAQYAGSGFNSFNATSNLLVVADNSGNVGVIGGSSAGVTAVVAGDGSNLSYIGGTGPASIIGGAGNDTVIGGSGNDTVALGAGSNQVYLGSGSSMIYSEGSDFIQAGSGSDTVSVTGANATINGAYGSSSLAIDASAGTNVTINVIDGATITGASASVTTINSYGDTTVSGGAGGTAYNQLNGTLRFVGVGASITVSGGPAAGNDTLYGSDGSNILLTSQAHNNIFVANDTVQGDGGDVLFDGQFANGGNQFWAGSGNATLIGGTGGDTMVGGSGAATMIGATGSTNTNYYDLFATNSGSSTSLTIDNFNAATDKLTLFNFGQTATQAALAGAQSGPTGTTLHLSNGASIFLNGISSSQLTAQNVLTTEPT